MRCDIKELKQKQNDFLLCLKDNLKSKDNLQRVDAVEIIGELLQDLMEQTTQLLYDKDELVQTSSLEAIDNIILFCNSLPSLMKTLLDSKSWLVRAYAIEVLGDIGDTSIKHTLQNMIDAADDEELIRLYYALAKLGDAKYLNKLYDFLHHDYYRVRIATATLLEKLISNNTKEEIIENITKQLKIEKEKSVIDRLNSILKENR